MHLGGILSQRKLHCWMFWFWPKHWSSQPYFEQLFIQCLSLVTQIHHPHTLNSYSFKLCSYYSKPDHCTSKSCELNSSFSQVEYESKPNTIYSITVYVKFSLKQSIEVPDRCSYYLSRRFLTLCDLFGSAWNSVPTVNCVLVQGFTVSLHPHGK